MATKSILYIITKSVWGGSAKYVSDLAEHLSKDSFNVSVASGGKGKFAQKIIKKNTPYFEIKGFQRTINPFKDVFAFFEILILLLKLKPDIVHTNGSKAGGIGGLAGWCYKAIAGKKVSLFFTAHGWAFAEDRPAWQISLIKFLSRVSAFFYDKIICVSKYDRRIALGNKIAPARKLIAIHNGLDLNNLRGMSREKAQEKLLGKISPFVVGTIAEWTKNKGLQYLLEAISLIRQERPEFKFDVVLIGSGENPDEKKLHATIRQKRMDNVHLHQWIENAASHLSAFDVFVLPSVKEGLPYTILEAMVAQVPVVASRVGGVPEIIDNGFSGILTKPKDSGQLIERVLYLVDHPEKTDEFTRRAKEEVCRRFSLKRMIEETSQLY